ncbi:YbjN domain-containing protein [Corynebacterium halotolerans]|uniref:YbjN domain-containing protein n=1 Tax=Corynebacterium halotolerans TaxID=225326 RepID=UPI003CF206A7
MSTDNPDTAGETAIDYNDQPLTAVSFERLTQVMTDFGIELFPAEQGNVASANLNGTQVTFALLNSVLIVRADVPTEQATAEGNPMLHLACNHVNSYSFACKSTVVDRTDTLIIRTEREILVAAGMTDRQLRTAVQEAVDTVLAGQGAVTEAAEVIRNQTEGQ